MPRERARLFSDEKASRRSFSLSPVSLPCMCLSPRPEMSTRAFHALGVVAAHSPTPTHPTCDARVPILFACVIQPVSWWRVPFSAIDCVRPVCRVFRL